MNRLVSWFATLLVFGAICRAESVIVAEPEVLPLSLDDSFRIEKVFTQVVDPKRNAQTKVEALKAEVERRYFGAINEFERKQREGNYFTVQWKAPKGSDLTVRLEYRQKNLGSHVQALEARYPRSFGSERTEFSVLGDDYRQDGAVTAWRLLLIKEGKIVGVRQSFLW